MSERDSRILHFNTHNRSQANKWIRKDEKAKAPRRCSLLDAFFRDSDNASVGCFSARGKWYYAIATHGDAFWAAVMCASRRRNHRALCFCANWNDLSFCLMALAAS